MSPTTWQLPANFDIPQTFIEQVQTLTDGRGDRHLTQLLWQRGFTEENQAELLGFLTPDHYQPTSPFDFGQEMKRAMRRLVQAINQGEKIAIWGDFDADGVTATSVLWEGLGQFFEQKTQLTYYVPNRLTESHGLNNAGIEQLKNQGITLIVTCDTGSTNLAEIAYAKELGLDIIVTDHHTLPNDRPDVLAIINPRYFAENHPLYHLSGVAVAYKLVEALYETLPDIPTQPVTNLLDLVAIGLIADLVALKGDCRYLAQRGIRQLQKQLNPQTVVHPGIKFLLEACRKNGDRPTDISFGIGPRINAVSRIHGDASFCVELLTSRDLNRCRRLAEQAESANTRRKEIQNVVVQQAKKQAATFDLSTTGVLVLGDRQWQGGVLGLVANQVAQEFGRPTILLTYDRDQDLWKGSARSVQGIDLYELVHSQGHLLHRFGGHPFAAGLSLKPENLELFKLGINQKARQLLGDRAGQTGKQIKVDLVVNVGELGAGLFRELKCLEPCGMGNPVPKILVQNCGLEITKFHKLRDKFNRKLNYYKVDFLLWDDTGELEGICWGKHPDEIPQGNGYDLVVELDMVSINPREQKSIVRLEAIAPSTNVMQQDSSFNNLVDFRQETALKLTKKQYVIQQDCPITWQDLHDNYHRARQKSKPLALAYNSPKIVDAEEAFKVLIGIAKYLVQHKKIIPLDAVREKIGCGDRLLKLALEALINFGFSYEFTDDKLNIKAIDKQFKPEKITRFQTTFAEEKFQQQYFCDVPLPVIQQTLELSPTDLS
ncbi:putative exonuclease, RecJ [[Leptolyngbya] sp. PCC 7376]|uniref:single-stranded-DNA-specific exonuclease RecJ n=1 Tax=[Leptolyngbya] sp. PCC 7376 TaxID=111781 RepID=UPI00029EEB4E|nr:single-stranded-DNA-specific exonuclease RecJ [[Leptolyngbya] sp. PCC 7376]AFY38920.1 putative exonuclease, RecJ [[Leptolyngbya] sp. PCC 7376]